MNRIFFWWRRFAAFQQFTRILTFRIGTTKILTKAAIFKFHIVLTTIALNNWAFITFDLKLTRFNFKAFTRRIITADV